MHFLTETYDAPALARQQNELADFAISLLNMQLSASKYCLNLVLLSCSYVLQHKFCFSNKSQNSMEHFTRAESVKFQGKIGQI